MKEFSATTNIAASPEIIWQLLTDASSYPEWDPGMVRLEGTVAPGQKITAYTKLSPDRAFPVTVTNFVPNQTMTWTGGMPLGLFKGERTFMLAPQADGTTQFTTREQFSGLLLPIIGRTIPDLSESFQNFAQGLKKRAENS
ncbi:MAG: SRPBCC domain-containing protein [Anaerolineales bacterium]|nr:SRPBCC domain-containing protein [Anaerolineales bacterium]